MSGFSPLDVIKEVKIRPGVYDRNALQPPRWEKKQQLWLEIAEAVTPQEEWLNYSEKEQEIRVGEVSNKWKNLRDHFYREVKLIESGDVNKKRKYIYYDEMQFVRPYIGYKSAPKIKRERKTGESIQEVKCKDNDSDIDMNTFLRLYDGESTEFPKKELVNQEPTQKKYKTNSKQNVASKRLKLDQRAEIKNFDLIRKKDDGKNPTFKIRESDISFCLSLIQHLRELSGTRKLSAKIDILKVLHKNLAETEQNLEEEYIYSKDDPLFGVST